MLKWVSSLVPSSQRAKDAAAPKDTAPAEDAAPPDQPAGIDRLLAQARETQAAPGADDAAVYDALMPVRRLSIDAPALLEPPPPPDLVTVTPDPPSLGAVDATPPATEPPQSTTTPQATAAQADPPQPPQPQPQPAPLQAPPVTWQTLHGLAAMAFDQRAYAIAADWWWLMRLAFPSIMHGFADGARALMHMHRIDEARQLLNEGEFRFPEEIAIPALRAELEGRVGDWAQAEEYWRRTLTYPNPPWWACGELALLLQNRGALDDADALLRQALTSPLFRVVQIDLLAARLAVKRRDWPALAERLRPLGDRYGDADLLATGLDDVMMPLRRHDPAGFATVIGQDWVARVTGAEVADSDRLINQARLCQLALDTPRALGRLVIALRQMPPTVDAYLRAETILREAEQWPAHESLLRDAEARFPMTEKVWLRTGAAKDHRGDRTGALAFWTEMTRRFPPAQRPLDRLYGAMLRQLDEDPAASLPERIDTPQAQPALQHLALAFASLGGSGLAGAEFALVQRHWGAEPLDPLRWAAVTPAALIAGLNDGFAALGDPARTEVVAPDTDAATAQGWIIRDTQYGLAIPSFIAPDDTTAEAMHPLAVQRLLRLRSALQQALAAPSRPFLLTLPTRRLETAEIDALAAALLRHPGLTLLCVCAADADQPPGGIDQAAPGSIDQAAPGLWLATLAFDDDTDWTARLPAWETLCQAALAQCVTAAPAPAETAPADPA